MRLSEDLIKSGFFWLPSNRDNKVFGNLIIKNGGEMELELFGSFAEGIQGKVNAINFGENAERIIGNVEKFGTVTLDNCQYKISNINLGVAPVKSIVRVGFAICGIEYEENELMTFDKFYFAVDGLDEWIGLTGIDVTFSPNMRAATINYQPQNEIKFSLFNGMNLSICFAYSLPGYPTLTEAKITQKCHLELSTTAPVPVKEFISAAFKISNFISFAVDSTVSLSEISVKTSEHFTELDGGTKMLIDFPLYYQSLPFVEKVSKIYPHTMLFRFGNIRKNFELFLNNWLSAYEKIAPALNLYFATKTGIHRYLDAKFLALAQGLETFHRRTSDEKQMSEVNFDELCEKIIAACPQEKKEWLRGRLQHGNELNLRSRLKATIAPFKSIIGNSNAQNILINSILDTRNYLTHYDKDLEKRSARGLELYALCQKMEALFQLTFLQMLGFEDAEIKKLWESHSALNNKLKAPTKVPRMPKVAIQSKKQLNKSSE